MRIDMNGRTGEARSAKLTVWSSSVVRAGMAVALAAGLACPLVGCGSIFAGEQKEYTPEPMVENAPTGATDESQPLSTMREGEAYSYDAAPVEEYDMYATEGEMFATEEAYGYYPDVYDPSMGYYGEPFNTEEYAALDETGFVAVATSPLSTVSSDVDTASYCNLRRMLNDGYLPEEIPAGSVRIEEMLNYFHYDYDAPEGDDLFGVTVRMGDCPWNPDTKLMVLGFSATEEADEAQADAGRNLVFLIDCSGSMDEPDKLPLLQQSFAELVDGLNANDRVSIVTYAGYEEVLASGVPGDHKREIMRAIRSIRADGSTNGEAGLTMAYQLAQENFIEDGVNRIVLASDGDLNVGMTSESDLHDYVEKQRETGIYLSVLGFGQGNYKDTKMETLADNGNGQYHYIDCEEEAQRVFGENLSANLEPLANDVKIQVEFNPAQVKGYRLIGYENRAMEDAEFEDSEADAGDVGPGSQFTVAYEVVPVDSAMEIASADLKYAPSGAGDATEHGDEWATCTMRYQFIDGGEGEQKAVVTAEDLSRDPGDDWRFTASVIEFGMLLRGSEYAGTATYDEAIALAEPSASADSLRDEYCYLVELARDSESYIIDYDGGYDYYLRDDVWYE